MDCYNKNISIIVAIDKDSAIGKNNKLLTHLPNDLKRFKSITINKTVIMGKNTLLSLPKHYLPNRRNIVISKTENFDNCEMVRSIQEAIDLIKDDEEAFVIGGGMIYKEFYPIVNKIYLTLINESFGGDTFFKIKHSSWVEESREDLYDNMNDYVYSYINLIRKQK